jgi:hypothetical protein
VLRSILTLCYYKRSVQLLRDLHAFHWNISLISGIFLFFRMHDFHVNLLLLLNVAHWFPAFFHAF